ncbi:hypothetical protein HAX54_018519 [Datura stramonium]|uniref:Uncharacterized protein n=1 Tax=Datura stramonium TaxID=4076 RepID=A0ABS8UP61_DATST|nr:hypothetical protein [Datura stramonium]
MDKATTTKIRPTTAKLRFQINLAKPLLHKVRVEGETRDLNGNVMYVEGGEIAIWTLLQLPQKDQRQNQNSKGEGGNNQEFDYKSSHKPPDLNVTEITRDEYQEVFHDIVNMETEAEALGKPVTRRSLFDNDLIKGKTTMSIRI